MMLSNKKIAIFFIEYFIYFFLVILKVFNIMSDFYLGCIVLMICIYNVINLIKIQLLFSPLLFSELFVITWALHKLQLTTQISNMSFQADFLILLNMFIWKFITMVKMKSIKKNSLDSKMLNLRKLKTIIYLSFPIAAFCMMYEWYIFGGVPAFDPAIEMKRMAISVNGLIHLIAISNKIIILLCLIYVYRRKKGYYVDIPIYLILFTSTFFVFGTGFRGELLFAFAIFVLAILMMKKTSYIKIFKFGLPITFILGVYPLIRKLSYNGTYYLTSLKKISKYKSLYLLTPFYETLSFNLEMFNRDFSIFPSRVSYGLGKYSLISKIPFLSNKFENIDDIHSLVYNLDFYGALTTTYLGNYYADFGIAGTMLVTILLCVFINHLYKKTISKDLLDNILYAFVLYYTLIGLYSDPITFSSIVYYLFIFLTFKYCRGELKITV